MRFWFASVVAFLVFLSTNRHCFQCSATEDDLVDPSLRQYDESPMQLRGGDGDRALQQVLGTITKFRLIDAVTDTPIMDLTSGAVINLATMKTSSLNIEALTMGYIGSILFSFAGNPRYTIDSYAPFALGAEKAGDFKMCPELSAAGEYTLTATPYSNRGAVGTSGSIRRITFKIVDKTCKVPKLLESSWSDFPPLYPLAVKETQGALIGNDIVIISGFINGLTSATNHTYARDITGQKGIGWRRMDDMPVAVGVTHGAFAVVGKKVYFCGGFYGGNPGPHRKECFVYNHAAPPTRQWSIFSSLPGAGTGGAGMVYDSRTNSLYYATGGQRNNPGKRDIDDVDTFFTISLNSTSSSWVSLGKSPHVANHISFVTAYDKMGNERHYFLGGQKGINECRENLNSNYEWNAVTKKWIQRANIPFGRGHATSSTLPISCGFVIAGGSINTPVGCFVKTPDISYYDAESDKWSFVGNLTSLANAPVCGIGEDGYFYFITDRAAQRRQIGF